MASRRAALDRLSDRCLVVGAVCGQVVLVVLLWFGVARVSGPFAGSYRALLAGLVLAILLLAGFLAFRRRLYRRLPAPRLLALLLAVLLPALLVEAVANLTNPRGYLYYANAQRYFRWQRYEDVAVSHAHPPDDQIGMPWGEIVTNSEGWRSPEVAPQPPQGTLRILALGDSVVFGWGVPDPDHLCPRLQAVLAERRRELPGWKRVQVVNTGNGSYDSIDELIVLKDRGVAYQPHAVFLLVIANDFARPPYRDQVEHLTPALNPALIEVLGARAVERPSLIGPRTQPARAVFGAVSYLVNRSFLTVTLASLLRRPAAPTADKTHDEPQPQPSKTRPTTKDAAAPPPADDLLSRLQPHYPYLPEHTEALREVALICRQRKIPLVFFTFHPHADPSAPCDLHRWLTTRLEELARVERLRFPDDVDPATLVNSATDSHWNREGTAWFADRMADVLVDRLNED